MILLQHYVDKISTPPKSTGGSGGGKEAKTHTLSSEIRFLSAI